MRHTPLVFLTMLLLIATALAVSEQEPNDEPLTPEGDPNPEYKGDVGEVGEIPVVVDGTIAKYGTIGVDADVDYHRITLATDGRLSVTLHGFAGNPNLAFFDEAGNIEEAFMPAFNTLNIFLIPQRHAVQQVAPFAGTRRLSYLSWLHR